MFLLILALLDLSYFLLVVGRSGTLLPGIFYFILFFMLLYGRNATYLHCLRSCALLVLACVRLCLCVLFLLVRNRCSYSFLIHLVLLILFHIYDLLNVALFFGRFYERPQGLIPYSNHPAPTSGRFHERPQGSIPTSRLPPYIK